MAAVTTLGSRWKHSEPRRTRLSVGCETCNVSSEGRRTESPKARKMSTSLLFPTTLTVAQSNRTWTRRPPPYPNAHHFYLMATYVSMLSGFFPIIKRMEGFCNMIVCSDIDHVVKRSWSRVNQWDDQLPTAAPPLSALVNEAVFIFDKSGVRAAKTLLAARHCSAVGARESVCFSLLAEL